MEGGVQGWILFKGTFRIGQHEPFVAPAQFREGPSNQNEVAGAKSHFDC